MSMQSVPSASDRHTRVLDGFCMAHGTSLARDLSKPWLNEDEPWRSDQRAWRCGVLIASSNRLGSRSLVLRIGTTKEIQPVPRLAKGSRHSRLLFSRRAVDPNWGARSMRSMITLLMCVCANYLSLASFLPLSERLRPSSQAESRGMTRKPST